MKEITYKIDAKYKHEGYLYVELNDEIVFELKARPEGYFVNLFSLKCEDEPLASTWLDNNSLRTHACVEGG